MSNGQINLNISFLSHLLFVGAVHDAHDFVHIVVEAQTEKLAKIDGACDSEVNTSSAHDLCCNVWMRFDFRVSGDVGIEKLRLETRLCKIHVQIER